MSKVYDSDTKKVLLAKFTASEQMKADNEGKATSKLEDYWRTKTYVKPDDMLNPHYPIFPQPYQLASHLLGGDWNLYNRCCVIQIAKCNLDCWYCYVDKQLRQGYTHRGDGTEIGHWFSPEEIHQMFKVSGTKVWRISGGEPTLAPEFLIDMINLLWLEDSLLWIDTNLVGDSRFYDLIKNVHPEFQENVGMCGCFKGFTEGDAATATRVGGGILQAQFDQARRMVEDTHLNAFFYVPGIVVEGTNEKHIRQFFERMVEEVDPMAPLRTYILEIKNYSSTEVGEWKRWKAEFPVQMDNVGYFQRPIDIWQSLLREYYTPEQIWLPNHQIQFQKRG